MKEVELILVKLRLETESKNDKELCEKLNINYSTLDTWKNKNKIPHKRLMEICNSLNISVDDIQENQNKTKDKSDLLKYFNALESVAIATKKEDELIDDIKDLIKKYV